MMLSEAAQKKKKELQKIPDKVLENNIKQYGNSTTLHPYLHMSPVFNENEYVI